jgi:putative transposase
VSETTCRSAWAATGVPPDRITTDGRDDYPRALRNVIGKRVMHRTNRYLNNHVKRDHRGIKQRHRPTCGRKTFTTAACFCRTFGEVRALFLPQVRHSQWLSLTLGRTVHQGAICRVDGANGRNLTPFERSPSPTSRS